jgi:hypothetical protein
VVRLTGRLDRIPAGFRIRYALLCKTVAKRRKLKSSVKGGHAHASIASQLYEYGNFSCRNRIAASVARADALELGMKTYA